MQKLRDEIFQHLGDINTPLWLPKLAGQLAEQVDLASFSYSTSRYLRSLPPEKIWRLETACNRLNLRIELLPSAIARMLETRGLILASETEILDHSLSGMQRAADLIVLTPSLATTLDSLVKSVHVLDVSRPGYDVSFSDPELPFSVFLNSSKGKYADLRTAEALIHEAMHLQLSLIERVSPIATTETSVHFSPWKKSKRPISGVMHALYVFKVIKQWLNGIEKTSEEAKIYAIKREGEISEEISQLNTCSYEEHLTLCGRLLLQRLLNGVEQAVVSPAAISLSEKVLH